MITLTFWGRKVFCPEIALKFSRGTEIVDNNHPRKFFIVDQLCTQHVTGTAPPPPRYSNLASTYNYDKMTATKKATT